MKKKMLFVMFVFVLLSLCICGCNNYKGDKNYTESTDGLLVKVPNRTPLYYDTNTKVVYVIFNECDGYQGYGYMSPYYSENGKLYRYVNGELEEIN